MLERTLRFQREAQSQEAELEVNERSETHMGDWLRNNTY